MQYSKPQAPVTTSKRRNGSSKQALLAIGTAALALLPNDKPRTLPLGSVTVSFDPHAPGEVQYTEHEMTTGRHVSPTEFVAD